MASVGAAGKTPLRQNDRPRLLLQQKMGDPKKKQVDSSTKSMEEK